ncbi:MAG: PIN domain-containing protein [Candidatus Poribacteria bacterium]|nr:PIN domain-containing protein [Candidatus Poribacteria bacterium]
MRYKAGEVRHYNFTAQDNLFLDANIWLYLYGPPKPRSYWRSIYESVFNRMLGAKSRIYIDVLVVSEFINAYARLKWRDASSYPNTFKTFRNSPDFELIAQGITAAVKQIMKHCSQVESCFTTLDMDDLLTNYDTGNFDFNDQVITEICKSNEFTLITNDGDFKTQEISILTANQFLLRN